MTFVVAAAEFDDADDEVVEMSRADAIGRGDNDCECDRSVEDADDFEVDDENDDDENDDDDNDDDRFVGTVLVEAMIVPIAAGPTVVEAEPPSALASAAANDNGGVDEVEDEELREGVL